jgi:hypothetical protein
MTVAELKKKLEQWKVPDDAEVLVVGNDFITPWPPSCCFSSPAPGEPRQFVMSPTQPEGMTTIAAEISYLN